MYKNTRRKKFERIGQNYLVYLIKGCSCNGAVYLFCDKTVYSYWTKTLQLSNQITFDVLVRGDWVQDNSVPAILNLIVASKKTLSCCRVDRLRTLPVGPTELNTEKRDNKGIQVLCFTGENRMKCWS